MFCKNCGFELDDAMTFCPECGTKAEAESVCEETAEPVGVTEEAADESTISAEDTAQDFVEEEICEECAYAEVVTAPEVEQEFCSEFEPEATEQTAPEYSFESQEFAAEPQIPAKKSNKLLVCLVAVVLMAALVVAGVFVVPRFLGGSREDVAMNYCLAYAESDMIEASKYNIASYVEVYDKMVDYSCEEYEMTREEFFELLSEQYGETVTEITGLFDIMKEDTQTYLLEEYGNYTISAKVLSAKDASAEEFEEIIDYINEEQSYDYPSMFDTVDTSKISEVCTVEVELTVNGTEDSETESQEITMAKYNGKWKVIGE